MNIDGIEVRIEGTGPQALLMLALAWHLGGGVGDRMARGMFHSQAWLDTLAARPGSRVLGLPTGHWVMVQRPEAFNGAVAAWLAETASVSPA